MEFVSSSAELLKVATDLPIALLCIPFAVLSKGRNCRLMFILLAVATIGGCFVHGILMEEMTLRICWVFLYGIMVTVMYYGYVVFMEISGSPVTEKQGRTLRIAGVATFIGCSGIRLITGRNMILLYVAYAIILAIQLVKALLKADRSIRQVNLLWVFILIISAGLLCQASVAIFPEFNGASAAHISIFAGLFVLFRASRISGEIK